MTRSGEEARGEASGRDVAPLAIAPYAYDDALVEAVRADGRTRVAVYPFESTVIVLGRGSDVEVELNLDAVRADGARVLRRKGGGCAVVLDPGNVIVTVVLAIPGLGEIRSTFDRLTRWLIDGLERAGVGGVRFDGISDLVLGDRKIAGSCVHRALGLFTFSASLLVAPDVALMSRYLAHPPREPEYRKGRSHEAFVGCIGDHAAGATAHRFAAALTAALGDVEQGS